MKFLVLDTNVLFSFFKGKKIFNFLVNLSRKGITLLVPREIIDELLKIKENIMKSANLSEKEWEQAFSLLSSIITPVSNLEYKSFFQEAKKISPHLKDVPLFALALKFECPIWSREPKLKKQKKVKVLNDGDVERILSKR